MNGWASTNVFGPADSTCSTGCCARTTRAGPPNARPEKETTDERTHHPRRLRHTDRAHHAENPAHAAWPDREGVGLSHRQRAAAQMAGRGRDGDARRLAVRTGLAQ